MKRLLAYLFIVLGLGLTFNASADAEAETTVKLVFKGQYVCLEGDANCGKYSPSGPISFHKWKSRKTSFNENGLCMSPEFGTVFYLHTIDSCDHYEKTYSIKYYKLTNLKDNIFRINGYTGKIAINKFDDSTGGGEGSSVVAKKESLKNFQFKCENKFNDRIIQAKYDDKLNHLFYVDGKNGKAKILAKSDRFIIFQIKTDYFVGNRVLDVETKQVLSLKGTSTEKKNAINFFKSNGYFNVLLKSQATCIEDETQIAKAEPSQTQKVLKRNNHLIKPNKWVYFVNLENTSGLMASIKFDSSFFLNNKKNMNKYFFDTNEKLFKYIRNKPGKDQIYIRISEKAHNLFFNKTDISLGESRKILSSIKSYKPKILKDLIDEYTEDNESKEDLLAYFNQKQPTITLKKKTKVAKVEELKQEEFKPKETNQDNEAPVIEIAEAITVDSQAYTLKGKVKDKSQIYLTIDGRQVDVKKGKFELDRFSINSDATEEIKIVAIDKWNNKSEKIVKVTIDLQSTTVAKVYEQLKPNNIKVKTDKNKIAIIIGIEKYENLTNLDAKYANRDAKAFRTYATRALGIKPSNIKMLIDDKATRSQALKAFKLWLPKIAGKGGKDIHIFFAGHGLASDNGEDLYILPQDGESSLLEDTAISRVELISLINKVNPKSVTMFFDTCYSGQTRDERMLVASLRPIRIVADEQETPDNFTIFTASNYDQTSGSIEEAEHGMFSYYLMKGLEGKADENKDRKITNGELITYLKDNVSQEAFTQNRQQDPMLAGDPDKILIKF